VVELKILELKKFRLSKSVKIKIDRRVCDLILKKNKYISKKDLGTFISDLILKQKDLDSDIHNYVSKKYSLEEITNILKKSNRNNIPFSEIRKMLDISKRVFYPRLRIIKKFFMNKSDFNWSIKRGRFVR
jgi:hypothetical protein